MWSNETFIGLVRQVSSESFRAPTTDAGHVCCARVLAGVPSISPSGKPE